MAGMQIKMRYRSSKYFMLMGTQIIFSDRQILMSTQNFISEHYIKNFITGTENPFMSVNLIYFVNLFRIVN